jgi:uncharacterized protein HemX
MPRRPSFRTSFLLAIGLATGLFLCGCRESEEGRVARLAQERQEQSAKDEQQRAALVAQTKAAMAAQDKKREAIAAVQAQIDAVEQQISYNRARARDCTALEKSEEDLEQKIFEIERR